MNEQRKRLSLPLRIALVAAIAFATAGTLVALLIATDTALSIGERLADSPAWLVIAVSALFATLASASAWAVYRLLRAPKRAAATTPRGEVTREDVDARLERLAPRIDADDARRELDQLDRRHESGEVHVALFGEISAGKTALIRALAERSPAATAPGTEPATGGTDPQRMSSGDTDAAHGREWTSDVRGGTTRTVAHARGVLPDGRSVVLADLPGLNEAGDTGRAALARAEALRAHALVYVADADLTRAQHEAFEAMLAIGKPALLALNKSDRYGDAERALLLGKLRERYGTRAAVVQVVAGGEEEIVRVGPDGRESRALRTRPPELAALDFALAELTAPGASALEPARQRAVLETLAQRLERDEARLRAEDAAAIVKRYTRRAIVGALAAVAPGTDIVIQGVLAAALLRELATLHGVSIREIDLDGFLERAAGTVRTTASVTLAIAGNVLKAFPGFGTVGGGLVHAVAYGLIFDALGRAAAQSLAERKTLGPEAEAQFRELLSTDQPDRLRMLADVVKEAIRR
ncbi:MAG TPA: GTPase [Candidatus Saccharimonadia bacterium]|nr:GTPase [Candidatus Saccharimonadia bacterium]